MTDASAVTLDTYRPIVLAGLVKMKLTWRLRDEGPNKGSEDGHIDEESIIKLRRYFKGKENY